MKHLAPLLLLPAIVLLSACHEQPLLHNLTEQQANDVVAVLQAHDVSVTKEDQGKTGFAVDVGQTDFPAAVDLLHKYNLPPSPRVEIDKLFPADALVASPQAEQARLLSGIEQRIEQSLASMNDVVTAKVQLSYPLSASLDGKTDPAMHAAVLLTYRNDANTDMLVSEVKRFIKNSFSNIEYDNISVILHPQSDLYRGPTTVSADNARATWLYWLLAIPVVVSLAWGALLVYPRLRRRAGTDGEQQTRADKEVPEADASEMRPSLTSSPEAPAAPSLDDASEAGGKPA